MKDQNSHYPLAYYPHIHMIVPAGGLSVRWNRFLQRRNFFLLVIALSAVFRGILCRVLEQSLHNGEIKI